MTRADDPRSPVRKGGEVHKRIASQEAVDGQYAVVGDVGDHSVDLILIGSRDDIAMREALDLPPNTQAPARFD